MLLQELTAEVALVSLVFVRARRVSRSQTQVAQLVDASRRCVNVVGFDCIPTQSGQSPCLQLERNLRVWGVAGGRKADGVRTGKSVRERTHRRGAPFCARA